MVSKPGGDEQHRVGELLELGEAVTVVVGGTQRGEQSGGRRGPGAVSGHDAAQRVGEALHVVDPTESRPPAGVEQRHDARVPVGGIDAEEQPGDLHREREGEALDQIATALGHQPIDQRPGRSLDGGPELVDGPRRERTADEITRPPVLGAVERHHPRVHDVAQRAAGDAERVGDPTARGETGVAQQANDVVVARDVPVPEVGLVDGIVLAQLVEQRERVVAGRVGEEVVRDGAGHARMLVIGSQRMAQAGAGSGAGASSASSPAVAPKIVS